MARQAQWHFVSVHVRIGSEICKLDERVITVATQQYGSASHSQLPPVTDRCLPAVLRSLIVLQQITGPRPQTAPDEGPSRARARTQLMRTDKVSRDPIPCSLVLAHWALAAAEMGYTAGIWLVNSC